MLILTEVELIKWSFHFELVNKRLKTVNWKKQSLNTSHKQRSVSIKKNNEGMNERKECFSLCLFNLFESLALIQPTTYDCKYEHQMHSVLILVQRTMDSHPYGGNILSIQKHRRTLLFGMLYGLYGFPFNRMHFSSCESIE